MVAYLDSSAAVKLVHREQHASALRTWISQQTDLQLVSSALVEVELYRALRRSDPGAVAHIPAVLARLERVEIDSSVRAMAGAYQLSLLRSLDAIHLASAELIAGNAVLDAFVAYDARLLGFAAQLGMLTVSPRQ